MSNPYFERRIDNEERWEFINSHLDNEETLLDVGCAEGHMTFQAAKNGMQAVGIDNNTNRIEYGEDEWQSETPPVLKKGRLATDDVHELPEVDVILFLTVHHHIFHRAAEDEAMEFFEGLCRKADKVFYEPRGDMWPPLYDAAVTATRTDNSETYKDRVLVRGRPASELDLPTGEYNVSVAADGYGETTPVTVTVGSDGELAEKLQIVVEDGELAVHPGRRVPHPTPANTDHYQEMVEGICDGGATVLDAVEVGHKGTRYDPLLAIDTRKCDPVGLIEESSVTNPSRRVWDGFEELSS